MINTDWICQYDPFDLSIRAENGLKRGFTTGASATAAVKAAVWWMLAKQKLERIEIALPDKKHYLEIPLKEVRDEGNVIYASVLKDGGDDPDRTHQATIWVRVSKNTDGKHNFIRGEGVGLVTEKGLQICVGEPAINPVPRSMILQEIEECVSLADSGERPYFDIEVGCENGEEIAKKTFNPRLGIQGGISILGTSGIVEPKSLKSFLASIEIYVRVALADEAEEVVFSPGNLGQRFAREALDLPVKRIVQVSNFLGCSLEYLQQGLVDNQQQLECLWVIGHPGKLAKVLNGDWDTHSSNSGSAVSVVCELLEKYIEDRTVLEEMRKLNTVEGVIQEMEHVVGIRKGWHVIEKKISEAIREAYVLKEIKSIKVGLFSMDGRALGGFDT